MYIYVYTRSIRRSNFSMKPPPAPPSPTSFMEKKSTQEQEEQEEEEQEEEERGPAVGEREEKLSQAANYA